jgi:hypothetical protein
MKGFIYLAFVLWMLPATAQELIAHSSTDIESLSRTEARLYLTMRLKNWPDGTSVKIFVLPDNDSLHQRFVNSILGLYPYQLRRVWDRQLFTGTGQAPVTVSSVEEMVQRVAQTPGALGYADSGVKNPDVRIIKVR